VTVAGWVPYLVGFALVHPSHVDIGQTAANTLLAAAAGGLGAMAYSHARYRKADVGLIFAGVMGGLVAITAGAGLLPSAGAVLLGFLAGILVPWATILLDLQCRIDDPVGGVAVHAMGGLFGIIATGALLPGTIGDRLRQVAMQAAGAAIIGLFTVVVSVALFLIIKATLGLRIQEADEFDGIDLAEHDLNAYPDFQQTTIKSYHLREA
jgi:Amt family ammonium transporter